MNDSVSLECSTNLRMIMSLKDKTYVANPQNGKIYRKKDKYFKVPVSETWRDYRKI